MWSIHHRGTAEVPGLVLALDRAENTHCDGVAFAVADENRKKTLHYLRERELISSAYLEKTLSLALSDGRVVAAVAFVIDPDHVQYCGHLTLQEQAGIIARATGGRGPNTEYLWNTATHLADLGIADPDLDWLANEVRMLAAKCASG